LGNPSGAVLRRLVFRAPAPGRKARRPAQKRKARAERAGLKAAGGAPDQCSDSTVSTATSPNPLKRVLVAME
jgi:hypothetical protein